ncbi:DUF2853 family protein [Lishizhenia sp.]|uniref:DUF2853 family protein n=1 Tax=Lishizhenia sp. TaxID=2497594 RepID=UPI00299E6D2E|nr:DUF2853 family protein [Lishizhenia sp.]MDX1445771.1 DUF2853 family protein [Lishizhenia sp.]
MSKRSDLINKYHQEMNTLNISFDAALFEKVVIGCGPAIFTRDSETVSASSETEINTVRQNFLIKKLGLADTPELDKAIDEVIEKFGRSNKNKYRAIFYYLLVEKFKKASVYA